MWMLQAERGDVAVGVLCLLGAPGGGIKAPCKGTSSLVAPSFMA